MRRIGIAALGLFLWMGVLPVHATNKLLIERVEPDLEQERLFIHGRYFGSQRGSVWLDYSALEVLDWSDQRIEAVLPSVTPPGTHRLLVERPGSSYLFAFRIDVMDVTLGAVGPQGAEGPEGQPGPEGPPGEMGLPGMDGEDGEPGEPGPPGPKGLNWRGAWVETEEYSRDDGVSHMGSSWIAHRGSTGVAPEEGEDWALLASRGEKGEQGAPGTPGEAGQQGPQGIPGPAGPQGIPGPPGGTVDPNGEFLRPEAPLNLVASAGQAGVALSWSPALGATSYTVKRSIAGSFGPYSSLATGLAASPYLDSSVEGETTYHYLVASVNPGAQTNSSPVAVTTSSSTPPGGNEAIALARITPDGPTTIEVSDVLVTFSSFSPLTQTTFFFVQAEQEGPALRVFYSGPTPPAPGDRVSFTIREMSTLQGGRVGGEIIDLAVVSEGNGVGAFLQDATNVDLVSQLDSYESELVRIENCVVVAVALVGGAWEVEFQTPGVPNPNGNLTLRFSSNLTPSITVGSAFHVAFAPVWRMNSRVQILVSDESQILQ